MKKFTSFAVFHNILTFTLILVQVIVQLLELVGPKRVTIGICFIFVVQTESFMC